MIRLPSALLSLAAACALAATSLAHAQHIRSAAGNSRAAAIYGVGNVIAHKGIGFFYELQLRQALCGKACGLGVHGRAMKINDIRFAKVGLR